MSAFFFSVGIISLILYFVGKPMSFRCICRFQGNFHKLLGLVGPKFKFQPPKQSGSHVSPPEAVLSSLLCNSAFLRFFLLQLSPPKCPMNCLVMVSFPQSSTGWRWVTQSASWTRSIPCFWAAGQASFERGLAGSFFSGFSNFAPTCYVSPMHFKIYWGRVLELRGL